MRSSSSWPPSRLNVEQERAWAERIRRVHDAARLPRSLPRGRVTCLVDLRRDAQCPAGEVVAPDTGRRPRGVRGGVLVLAPGVLLEEDAGAGGLDVVRIVDERRVARARRTERVALDEDRQAEDVRLVGRVEHQLEDPTVRERAGGPRGA